MRIHHTATAATTAASTAAAAATASVSGHGVAGRDEGSVHAERDAAGATGAIERSPRMTARRAAGTHEEPARGSVRRLTHWGSWVKVEVPVRRRAVRVKLGTLCETREKEKRK